jgi:hypothetical protein
MSPKWMDVPQPLKYVSGLMMYMFMLLYNKFSVDNFINFDLLCKYYYISTLRAKRIPSGLFV